MIFAVTPLVLTQFVPFRIARSVAEGLAALHTGGGGRTGVQQIAARVGREAGQAQGRHLRALQLTPSGFHVEVRNGSQPVGQIII